MDYETGELVCYSCGLVISFDHLDLGPEWRAFDEVEREKLPRVGAPMSWTIHDKGLSTTISWEMRDAHGQMLSPESRARIYRIKKWDTRSKLADSYERNLAYALSEINGISYKLNLPKNVIETSSIIYRQALQRKLIRGRTIQSIAVATIYMACRQCNIIRSLKDIANVANITVKDAARNYRFLIRELNQRIPSTNPSGYISSLVNKLGLRGETERLALQVLSIAANQKFTTGRGPNGMAAACVYISSQLTGERLTQAIIAKEAQVTEVTIRNRYKELVQKLEFNLLL
jgi:transcription initiation factor TFIIB